MGSRRLLIGLLAAIVLTAAACGNDDGAGATDDQFPDVIAAEARWSDDGTWRISATLRSPYDSPERYADAWRVLGPDGEVLGVRELLHDHAGEQPFTRSLDGLELPEDLVVVTIEGRDLVNGWGGATVEVPLDRDLPSTSTTG